MGGPEGGGLPEGVFPSPAKRGAAKWGCVGGGGYLLSWLIPQLPATGRLVWESEDTTPGGPRVPGGEPGFPLWMHQVCSLSRRTPLGQDHHPLSPLHLFYFCLFFPIAWTVHAPGNPFRSSPPAGFFLYVVVGQDQTGFVAESCLWFCGVKCARASAEAPIKTVKSLADSCLPQVRQRGPCLHVGLKKKGGGGEERRGPNYLVTSMSRWRQLGNGPNELIAFGLGHNEGRVAFESKRSGQAPFPPAPTPYSHLPSPAKPPPTPTTTHGSPPPHSSITSRRSREARGALSALSRPSEAR